MWHENILTDKRIIGYYIFYNNGECSGTNTI